MTRLVSASMVLRTAAIGLLVACLPLFGACDDGKRPSTRYYSADSITASVVDADSGAPISGANVIAAWIMKAGLENNVTSYAMVMEAVTDEAGKFSFPAWGPKAVTEPGQMTTGAPAITIFKSGYQLAGGGNLGTMQVAPPHMSSYWDGRTFKLQRFEGSMDEYAQYLDTQFGISITSLLRNGCHGKSIPRFLLAVDRQSQAFTTQRTRRTLAGLQYWSDSFASKCGPIAEIVKEMGR